VTVGEEAQAWSGPSRRWQSAEWPDGFRRLEIQARSAPDRSAFRRSPSLGARALYLRGHKDTLYRIHGNNQPEYIGQASVGLHSACSPKNVMRSAWPGEPGAYCRRPPAGPERA